MFLFDLQIPCFSVSTNPPSMAGTHTPESPSVAPKSCCNPSGISDLDRRNGVTGQRESGHRGISFAKATGPIAIVAIIADHLLPRCLAMRCHGRKPIEGIKDLFHLSVFGLAKGFGILGKIGHPLLGKGGPIIYLARFYVASSSGSIPGPR